MRARRTLVLLVGVALISVAIAGCDPKDDLPQSCQVGDLKEVANDNPSTPPSGAPSQVLLDPTTLRKILLEGNTSVLLGLNRLHKAKDEVNIARGNLLPSLKLDSLLLSGANPVFALSSIDFLLPFLIPSNWFELFKQENLYEAERAALQTMKLDTYASAYSLYFTALSDQHLQQLMVDEVNDLAQIEEYVRRAYDTGFGPAEDWLQAKGELDSSRVQLSKVNDLISGERASIRQSLGYGLNVGIQLLPAEVPASEFEDKPMKDVFDVAWSRSTQAVQLEYLKRAAESGTWSETFSFITGADLKPVANENGRIDGGSFGHMKTGGSLSIGFAYFPTIQLSQRDIEDIKIRQQELALEIGNLVEVSINAVQEAKNRLEIAQRAEQSFSSVYTIQWRKYLVGMGSLVETIRSRKQLRDASVEVLRSQLQLAAQRINLHRLMVSDQFAQVPVCQASAK